MRIEILGSGCAKCENLEANVRAAVASAGVQAIVEKVSDDARMRELGVLMTPALAIDGKIESVGAVLSEQDVRNLIDGRT